MWFVKKYFNIVYSYQSAYRTTVTSMTISEDSSLLCVADHGGYIYIFHVLHFALRGPETHPPESKNGV